MQFTYEKDVLDELVVGEFSVFLKYIAGGRVEPLYEVSCKFGGRRIFQRWHISKSHAQTVYEQVITSTKIVSEIPFNRLPLYVNDYREFTRILVLQRLKG